MKIAVSSSGNDLDSQVDPRFGRCAYFVIVETDDMGFEAFENGSIALGGGAGIQAGQFVASKGAKAIITGNVGPNAVQTLSAAGVETFVGQSGTVREAIERYTKGKINSTSTPNVADHYGMGSGAGMSRGMGMGGGRGMGRGMGMDGGMGRGMGSSTLGGSSQSAPPALSKEDELKSLKDQANEMRKQIEGIESSINALEKK
ncbi:MAG: NifB/NifX family molybdenum-iron cluster-binding protein, partial [Thermodesulfobacteriota bacterium]|nr:NifB/NifX family molybdenum-iron cluster-binding protein [Thermodesulfobacteriota bacterium]